MPIRRSKFQHILKIALSLSVFLFFPAAWSETRIAVLDFELKDLTLKPATTAELARTASIKPMLERELAQAGYEIIHIDRKAQRQADSGIGYLFDHHDTAAELGRRYDADYILVGRLHKPSFLFAYLMGHLINVSNGELIGNFITETKGGEKKLTLKAVETLADEIDNKLDNRYCPPAAKRC